MMFDPLTRILKCYFLPKAFMLKSEWNRLGKCPVSDYKVSSEGVIDVEDNYDILYSQKYIVPLRPHSHQILFPYRLYQGTYVDYLLVLTWED